MLITGRSLTGPAVWGEGGGFFTSLLGVNVEGFCGSLAFAAWCDKGSALVFTALILLLLLTITSSFGVKSAAEMPQGLGMCEMTLRERGFGSSS